MPDRLTPEQRHKNMVAIKSKDTGIEVILRKELWRRGLRGYRKNYKKLPGNSKNSEDNFILNKMQITRRRRDLNIEEKQELLNIANNNIRADIKCGAYLLLDNIEKAQECFYEIDTKLQDCFLEYPINIFGKLTRTNTSKD